MRTIKTTTKITTNQVTDISTSATNLDTSSQTPIEIVLKIDEKWNDFIKKSV